MNYVIDASVILKWFLQEPESASALTFRHRHETRAISLACPDIVIYEFGNVLRYKPDVTEPAIRQAISDLLSLELELFHPTENLLHQATSIARSHNLTVYDASYVALALELKAALVTADLKFARQVKNLLPVETLLSVH